MKIAVSAESTIDMPKELLAQYEKSASMHFALEYRGDAATAQKYLDRQNEYFASKGE